MKKDIRAKLQQKGCVSEERKKKKDIIDIPIT
jgi:hypothetical protein